MWTQYNLTFASCNWESCAWNRSCSCVYRFRNTLTGNWHAMKMQAYRTNCYLNWCLSEVDITNLLFIRHNCRKAFISFISNKLPYEHLTHDRMAALQVEACSCSSANTYYHAFHFHNLIFWVKDCVNGRLCKRWPIFLLYWIRAYNAETSREIVKKHMPLTDLKSTFNYAVSTGCKDAALLFL